MQITSEGLALIKRFEGFRAKAYRDAVGVRTIGYGHTSMAGAPAVHEGLAITRSEASNILKRDIEMFAEGVRRLVRTKLTDAQFSALVSFAFNVGLANFARSSVLKAVNVRDFDAVPRRLALWVKAGGRALPGLIKRRAAEAELFAKGDDLKAEESKPAQHIEAIKGKPAYRSTINWAAIASAFAGVLSSILAAFHELADRIGGPQIALAAAVVMVLAAAWIVYERRRKSREEGV